MTRDQLPRVTSPALDAFARLATQYCDLVETRTGLGRERFLGAVLSLLPRLYAAALDLPQVAGLFENASGNEALSDPAAVGERADPDREISPALFGSLSDLIGDWNLYREVFDPYEPVTEPEVAGSLADDIVDVYRDIRAGLLKWRRGESGEALWEWRFNFESHWGQHVTGALRALHALAASYEAPWFETGPGPA